MYELDTKLLIINRILILIMQAVSYTRYTVAVLTDVHTGVTCLNSGTLSLKENVDALCENFRVLASHKETLLIVPPVEFCNKLVKF